MKLKLESDQNITILNVLEDVAVPHAAILRAGIAKLIDSGKKAILVDLTTASFPDSAAIFEVTNVTSIAAEKSAQIVLVCGIEGVGHARTRAEGIALLGTNVAGLMATEAKLQAEFERFKARKAELEQQFAKMGGGQASDDENDPKNLRKENTELRQLVASLERQIEYYLKGRQTPFEAEAAKDRNAIVERTVKQILEYEGVLR